MKRITVRVVRSKRDGTVLKWTDPREGPKQRKAFGRTQREVAKEAREFEDELNQRRSRLTWDDFDLRYRESYLDEMSKGHRNKTKAMVEKVTAVAKSRKIDTLYCSDLSVDLILEVESAYRKEKVADATIRSSMATLWAMLGWGMDAGLIPYFRRPRRRKGKQAKKLQKSKGRSLTLEEIERMTDQIPNVCKPREKPAEFILAMSAMRLIGLRLSDCWHFRWEPMEGTHYPLNLDGKRPVICFSDLQKSGEEEQVPLTPDAVVWLRSIQKETGWVCRTRGAKGIHKTESRLGRVIAEAGKAAGIIVKSTGGKKGKPKYASSHDLRRTFATTWHQKLSVSELQKLTRHSDSQTLLSYYADAPTEALAEKLSSYAEKILRDESGGEDGGDDESDCFKNDENTVKTSTPSQI